MESVADIVVRAQAGDLTAFGRLYELFQRLVMHCLLKRGLNLPDAEDLCPDIFLHVRKKIGQLKNPAAFPGWIRTAATRMGINFLMRKKRRERWSSLNQMSELEDELETFSTVVTSENSRLVTLILGSLGPMDREILSAYYWRWHSVREMAEMFDAPEGTIKRRLFSARKRFKARAAKRGLVGVDS